VQPLLERATTQHAPDQALARDAHEHGRTKRHQRAQFAQQRQIMRQGLAETDTRVQRNGLGADPGRNTSLAFALQKPNHLCDDIAVVRVFLHGARLALHVHEAYARRRRCSPCSRTGCTQRVDIIDDRGAGAHRGSHYAKLARIDGYRNVEARCDRLDQRDHALHFHRFVHAFGAWTSRFSADIDDARTLGDDACGAIERWTQLRVASAVEK
jgi:hypothetical protein